MISSVESVRVIPDVNNAQQIVAATSLRGFPELVRQLGGDPDRLLQTVQIDADALETKDAVIEYRSMLRVMSAAAKTLSCPDFGLRLAALQGGNKAIGPIGVVMKNSRTLGQAIGYCAKHIHAYSLATKVRFVPDRARHQLLVRLEILLAGPEDPSQVVEHALMLASLNIAEITATAVRPRKILFRHAPNSTLQNYFSRFGCDVRFGQKVDGLILTEQDLMRPVVEPDDRVYEMATTFIDMRYPQKQAPFLARVRHLIQQCLDSKDCTCERIAAELCMHPRTLQRHLQSEGSSFEDLKDSVRRDMALQYIKRDDMLFKHVSEKLGYSDPAIFSRSCHRWFSVAPRVLRSRLKSCSSAEQAINESAVP